MKRWGGGRGKEEKGVVGNSCLEEEVEREEFRPHVIHAMFSDPDRIAGPCNPSEMSERNVTNNAVSTRGSTVSNVASIRCSPPLAKEN